MFLTLVVNSGFRQIKIEDRNVAETAFVLYLGLLCCTRMLLGLKDAPATFQKATDIVSVSIKRQFCYSLYWRGCHHLPATTEALITNKKSAETVYKCRYDTKIEELSFLLRVN